MGNSQNGYSSVEKTGKIKKIPITNQSRDFLKLEQDFPNTLHTHIQNL